jgi:hypothetical protein
MMAAMRSRATLCSHLRHLRGLLKRRLRLCCCALRKSRH